MSIKIKTKVFSSHPGPLVKIPDLIEAQKKSYSHLLNKGLRDLFRNISPISDYTGKNLDLDFVDAYVDKPKYNEVEAMAKYLSFVAPIREKVKLTNKKTKEVKEKEIYFGDIPI